MSQTITREPDLVAAERALVRGTPPITIDAAVVERVLIHGDLRQLTPAQKVSYYKAVCESVGLNPLTQPFQYLVLNGKEILYALRAATEQLRQIHSVSVSIMAREVMEDCYIVTARATLPTGRQDENIGAVPIAGLKGEARANAMMKAETKAKRRVTLAICGLGMLDETEVESIQAEPTTAYAAPTPATATVPTVALSGGANTAEPPVGDRGSLILKVEETTMASGKLKGKPKWFVYFEDGVKAGTINRELAGQAHHFRESGTRVTPHIKRTDWGNDLIDLGEAVPF